MTRPPELSALPSLTLRGTDGRIWLQGRAVRLERDGVSRRIPVAAIAEARVTGAARRTVEIVVRGGDGTPGPVFEIEGRNATAARRLVATVNQALPDEPRRGGAELVEVLPKSARTRRGDPRARAVALAFLAVYVTGLVVLGLWGEPGQAMLWGLGFMPLAAGLLVVVPAAEALRNRWVMRERGVTVVAAFERSAGKKRYFRFIDQDGVSREIRADHAALPLDGDGQRIEVTYDPLRPERVVTLLPVSVIVLRTLGVAVFGLPLVLIGLFMGPYQLVSLLFS